MVNFSGIGFKRFAALQVLDLQSTLVGFNCGMVEANPAINHFFPGMGVVAGLMFGKLLMVLLLVGFMWFRNVERWAFVNILFGLLVCWNSTLIGLRLCHVV